MAIDSEWAPERAHLEEVGDNAYVLMGDGTATHGGFIVMEEAVMAIDSLTSPILAQNFIQVIKKTSTKPIRYLVNTHFHGDHTFGNEFFPEARILSHANCRREFLEAGETNIESIADGLPELAEDIRKVHLRPPDVTFVDRMTLYDGSRELRLLYLGPAHTFGDTLVYLPDERLLYAGDIAFLKVVPYAGDGYISGWIRVIDEVEKLEVDRIVPGHGPIGTMADLRELRDYFFILRDEARRCYDSGMSEEEADRAVKVDKYRSWLGQEANRFGSITQLYKEFRGEMR